MFFTQNKKSKYYTLNDFFKSKQHKYLIQHVAKSIATCKKNPYIINQNHIFSKTYCEDISG
jgi:hypothetical protein